MPFHSICPFLPYCDRPPPLCVHCARPREAAQTTAVDGHRRRSKLRSCSLVTKHYYSLLVLFYEVPFTVEDDYAATLVLVVDEKDVFVFPCFFLKDVLLLLKLWFLLWWHQKKRSLLCVSIWKVTKKTGLTTFRKGVLDNSPLLRRTHKFSNRSALFCFATANDL